MLIWLVVLFSLFQSVVFHFDCIRLQHTSRVYVALANTPLPGDGGAHSNITAFVDMNGEWGEVGNKVADASGDRSRNADNYRVDIGKILINSLQTARNQIFKCHRFIG